ncbi:MAG: DUF1573 domain-containing protein [Candidatus Kapaibacterium sp.]
MRKFIVLIATIILVGAAQTLAQPKIEIIGGDTYNWQTVSTKDSPLNAKIKIKNAGDQTLEITKVKPTCGCTTAPLDKNTLAPGETASMDVTLSIGSHSGPVHKSIRVNSNDPATPMKIIGLKAMVKNPIDIGPTSYFAFNEMTVGAESKSTIQIKNNTEKPIKLYDFKLEPENLALNFKSGVTLAPGESFDMTARVTPSETGYFRGSVKFKTNHPDYPEMSITAYGRVIESPIYNSK